KPDFAGAYNNMGDVYKEEEKFDDAIACFRQAIAFDPNLAEAYNNLGNAYQRQEQYELAITNYRQAVQIKPDYDDVYNNLGLALHSVGQFPQAIECFERLIELQPDSAPARNYKGLSLSDLGRYEEAIASFHQALALDPKSASAYNNLGDTQQKNQQIDAAIASYLQAIAIDPKTAEAHNNLGNSYQDLNQYDTAIKHYRQALAIEPDFHGAYSNMLFCVNYHPDYSSEELYDYYKEYEERFARPLYKEWQAHTNNRDPERRLKVGYVSPSLYNHSSRHFIEPLLAHHDHSRFEIYAYAQYARADDATARYQSYVDHWIPTRGMSYAALAERIRSDGIDILIDVTGHTGENRLLVFARKPAPVSLHWLDFGYTTGLTAIDYYLTDAPTAPPGSDAYFAEKLWRLPTPAYAYRPIKDIGEVGELPASRKGHITFGTLTRSVRINYKLIRAWSEILKAVPGSHLIINSGNFKSEAMQERMAKQFMAHGIERARLEIGHQSPPWDVLRN
ncbi:MAG TPA: tetratricopeptide repeat protein, partial [Methylophilaceae bacterium]